MAKIFCVCNRAQKVVCAVCTKGMYIKPYQKVRVDNWPRVTKKFDNNKRV